MNPEHVVYIESKNAGEDKIDEMMKWCKTHVGIPYSQSEDNPHVVDYDGPGMWGAYINFAYNNGENGPVHSWCFLNNDDALAFSLTFV